MIPMQPEWSDDSTGVCGHSGKRREVTATGGGDHRGREEDDASGVSAGHRLDFRASAG